jgi:hypothetical protein
MANSKESTAGRIGSFLFFGFLASQTVLQLRKRLFLKVELLHPHMQPKMPRTVSNDIFDLSLFCKKVVDALDAENSSGKDVKFRGDVFSQTDDEYGGSTDLTWMGAPPFWMMVLVQTLDQINDLEIGDAAWLPKLGGNLPSMRLIGQLWVAFTLLPTLDAWLPGFTFSISDKNETNGSPMGFGLFHDKTDKIHVKNEVSRTLHYSFFLDFFSRNNDYICSFFMTNITI